MESFLENFGDDVDDIVQEIVGEDQSLNEVMTCVISNQEIQNKGFYYLLGHVKFSNVSRLKNLRKS